MTICWIGADMAHIYKKFIGPLPSAVEEYVLEVQKHFPYIVDTKVLLNSDSSFLHLVKKGSTSLSKAFTLLCPQIVSSSISSIVLADKPRIKVEVHVDNKRLVPLTRFLNFLLMLHNSFFFLMLN